jgi:peptidoglycan/LPS O-acetylase OafA/YrhL
MAAGFTMQFVWTAARPDLQNAELLYHTGIYSTGGLNTSVDTTNAQIRADCYLIILGFFLVLESSSVVQSVFRNKFLVLLGRRSLSTSSIQPYSCSKEKALKEAHSANTNNFAGYFLIQSTIVYTLGVKIAANMTSDGRESRYPAAAGVSFVATLLVTIVAAEVMYRIVELPSKWFGRWLFDWIRA